MSVKSYRSSNLSKFLKFLRVQEGTITWSERFCLYLLFVCFSVALPAEEPVPNSESDYRMLFFGPEAPHFVCLQIRIDKETPQQKRLKLMAEVFRQTDTDADSKLNSDELKKVGGGGRMANAIRSLASSGGEALDLQAFQKLLLPSLGIPFGMQASSAKISDLPDLFQKLDQDRNRTLTSDEWNSALQLLEQYDYDDDETLNLVEVMPLLRPLNFGQAATPSAGTQAGLFRLLNGLSQTTQVAQQLLAQYDGGQAKSSRLESSKPVADGHLSAAELGWQDKMLQPYDSDQDDVLSLSELEQMLKSPPAQHTWRMRMPLEQRVSVRIWRERSPDREWKFPRSATSRNKFRLGRTEFQVRVRNPRPQFADVVSLAQIQFLQADSNKDGQVSVEEFGPLRLPFTFETIDSNKDKMLTREEVTAIVEQDSALAQSQILMNVDQQSESLFRLLDVDKDRRLEPRELKNAAEKMKTFDSNQDQRLTSSEMKSVFMLTFTLEAPRLFQNQFGMNLSDQIAPILSPPLSGPEWFRRMDRNLDGDLTPREFLGPVDLFVQFDLDQDGLIDPEEAEKISN